MRALVVYLTLIALVVVSLAAGFLAADWPAWCHRVHWCASDWPPQRAVPAEGASGSASRSAPTSDKTIISSKT